MRLPADEFIRVRNEIVRTGNRYGGADLKGAVMDADNALTDAGFTDPEIKKPGDVKRMVVYTCSPAWAPTGEDEIVEQLEQAWAKGAFEREAHTVAIDQAFVLLDFVTWWDDRSFYTGRIEVALSPRRP